ncbi:MAG: NAD(P)-dependent oxidoreductase, partial [Candidatus Omnitrophota bacterium]
NTPDGPTRAVVELTIGLVLSLLRGIPSADRETREGKWQKRMGCLLQGKTVGIVGFGHIGRQAAEVLHSMGAKILYCDPVVNEGNKVSLGKRELPELLKESDIVSLHLSYSKENKRLIGAKELALMKKSAFLVNVSRGGIVDENALYEALEKKLIAGAAIDVFEEEPYNGELKKLDNVVLTPHIGSYAREARVNMEVEAAKNLLQGLEE